MEEGGKAHWLEGGHALLRPNIGRVVDGHAARRLLETRVGLERDALVGAVTGAEEEHGGPVVGEVVGKCARRACGLARWRLGRVHGHVEGILKSVVRVRHPLQEKCLGRDTYSADNLVKMRRRCRTRVDQAVRCS